MLTGLLRADAGTIRFDGRDITRLPVHRRIRLGLSRSFQILSVFRNLTAFENVRVAVQARSPQRHALWRDAYATWTTVNARTWSLLAAVGLADRAAEPCANLSHGERRLLEIAISLATDARLLLLDEPLAGLAEADREVVGALIRQLGDDPCGAADRARHRPRAGAVGPHHRAAPGAADRRRQAGRGGEQSRGDHRLSGRCPRERRAVRTVRAAMPRQRVRTSELLRLTRRARRLWRQRGAGWASISWCTRARRWRCWAATALARRRRCARSPARCAKSAGSITIDGKRHHRSQAVRDQPAWYLAGAGGAAAVPQPDRGREPAHRRAAGWRLARRGLRAVPEAA